jgi:hypothetical protein
MRPRRRSASATRGGSRAPDPSAGPRPDCEPSPQGCVRSRAGRRATPGRGQAPARRVAAACRAARTERGRRRRARRGNGMAGEHTNARGAHQRLHVAALGLLRESRELAKLLTATLGAFCGEREDVLESHAAGGSRPGGAGSCPPRAASRDEGERHAGGRRPPGVVSSLPYGIRDSASPAAIPSATRLSARRAAAGTSISPPVETDKSHPLPIRADRLVEPTGKLAQGLQVLALGPACRDVALRQPSASPRLPADVLKATR